jgi:hypothetical protein
MSNNLLLSMSEHKTPILRRAGGDAGGGLAPIVPRESGDVTPGKIFEILDAKSCILVHFDTILLFK